MGYIFISYSHKDTTYAHGLADHLKSMGFDIWMDERLDYGSQWPLEIQKQLDACAAFILIMTPRSFASDWVQSELQRAKRKLKPIFPLLLEGNEPWLSVESTQYYDVRGEVFPDARFYSAIKRVISTSPRAEIIDRLPRVDSKKDSATPRPKMKTELLAAAIGGIATVIAACATMAGPLMSLVNQESSPGTESPMSGVVSQVTEPQPEATSTLFIPSPTITSTIPPTQTNVPPTATLPPTLTPTPSSTPTPPLAGQWYWNGDPGPVIYVVGNSLQIDMSAIGRSSATGRILNASTIEVTFDDNTTFIGRLVGPNRIEWSNGTVWEK